MQLGRESISSSVTAIIELVKNAYDADARNVHIRFGGLEGDAPKMVVEDDGDGMSTRDLQASWMVIGVGTKAWGRKPTAKGRVMTGEKGLGRLGLDRLCQRTLVQSKKKGTSEALELDVDWTRYEGSEARLESIEHHIYSLPHLNFDPLTGDACRFPHGTRLVLEHLGGTTSMDLDHFRPRSHKRFAHLADEPRNLIYACKSCNGLKSDWWPAKGKVATFRGQEGFLDPFGVNRKSYFLVQESGAIRARQAPAQYMIELLALDRPFLQRLREHRVLKQQLAALVIPLERMANACIAGKRGVNLKAMSKLTLEMTDRVKRLLG